MALPLMAIPIGLKIGSALANHFSNKRYEKKARKAAKNDALVAALSQGQVQSNSVPDYKPSKLGAGLGFAGDAIGMYMALGGPMPGGTSTTPDISQSGEAGNVSRDVYTPPYEGYEASAKPYADYGPSRNPIQTYGPEIPKPWSDRLTSQDEMRDLWDYGGGMSSWMSQQNDPNMLYLPTQTDPDKQARLRHLFNSFRSRK